MIRSECFDLDQIDDITIVRILDTWDFDSEQYAQLRRDLTEIVGQQQPKNLLVDLGDVEHCSTSLTSTLLMVQNRMRSWSGAVRLFGLSPVVMQTLQRLSLAGTVFSVYADEATAKQACLETPEREQQIIRTESFSAEQSGDITIVRFADTRFFDTDKYAQLQADLLGFVARERPHKLIVDLGNIEYCSSAVTNTLLLVQKRMTAWNGKMNLFGLSELVQETLHRLRLLGTCLSVCANEMAAKQAFQYSVAN